MPYPRVYAWVQQCLQDSAAGLDASATFDRTIESVLGDLFSDAFLIDQGQPSPDPVAFYEALTGTDRARIDEAAGLLTAARLIGPLSTGGANGQLLSEKTESVSRTFEGGPGNKEEWTARAAFLFKRCSFAPKINLLTVGMFAAVGPTRNRRTREGCE